MRPPDPGIHLQFYITGLNEDSKLKQKLDADYPGHKNWDVFARTEEYDGGEFHDQADAKWIVIRGQLRGHNDMPFGQPTPGAAYRPPGGWTPLGRDWCFQLLLISKIVL
jgi:hypothetical protein